MEHENDFHTEVPAAGVADMPAAPVKKKFFDKAVPATLVAMLLALFLMTVGQVVGDLFTRDMQYSSDAAIAFGAMYLAFIGIWVVVLGYCRLTKKNRPIFKVFDRRPEGNRAKTALILGLSTGIGMNLLVAFVAMLHGDIHLTYNSFQPSYFVLLLFFVAIQSGAEELVCRAFLYQRLIKACPKYPVIAIFGNALFFGALHLGNPGVGVLPIINIVAVGVLYSLFIYYYDSFWGAVVAHTTWNFCQSILLGLPNSGLVSAYSVFKLDAATAVSSFTYDVSFGIEGTILADILLILACVAVWYFGHRREHTPIDIWSQN